MVNYERPELVEVSDFVETVNLASGTSGWDVEVKWEGHNGGGYSEFRIIARKPGTNGSYFTAPVKVTISYLNPTGLKLTNVFEERADHGMSSTYGVGATQWTVTLDNVIMSNAECKIDYACKMTFEQNVWVDNGQKEIKAYYVKQEDRESSRGLNLVAAGIFSVIVS